MLQSVSSGVVLSLRYKHAAGDDVRVLRSPGSQTTSRPTSEANLRRRQRVNTQETVDLGVYS